MITRIYDVKSLWSARQGQGRFTFSMLGVSGEASCEFATFLECNDSGVHGGMNGNDSEFTTHKYYTYIRKSQG